jgi:hypothetical protein
VNYILSLIHLYKRRSLYLVRVNFLCDFCSSFCFKFNPIWPAWKRYFFLDYNYILEEVMLLTVHGWPPKPECINARQLFNQLMEQDMSVNCIFWLRLCEIPLAKHHTQRTMTLPALSWLQNQKIWLEYPMISTSYCWLSIKTLAT